MNLCQAIKGAKCTNSLSGFEASSMSSVTLLLSTLVDFLLDVREFCHEIPVYQLNEFDISCVDLAYSLTESPTQF